VVPLVVFISRRFVFPCQLRERRVLKQLCITEVLAEAHFEAVKLSLYSVLNTECSDADFSDFDF
jgi:hypothetical protein